MINSIFSEEEIAKANYVQLKQFYGYRIWKNSYTIYSFTFFIKNSLYQALGFESSN